jgi:hypothetical protein
VADPDGVLDKNRCNPGQTAQPLRTSGVATRLIERVLVQATPGGARDAPDRSPWACLDCSRFVQASWKPPMKLLAKEKNMRVMVIV